jgi:hypothetical protein
LWRKVGGGGEVRRLRGGDGRSGRQTTRGERESLVWIFGFFDGGPIIKFFF